MRPIRAIKEWTISYHQAKWHSMLSFWPKWKKTVFRLTLWRHPSKLLIGFCYELFDPSGEWILIPVLAKIISGLPDKMSCRPSMICRTFWLPAEHFSKLMNSNSCLPCRGHFLSVESCETKCPAMLEPSAGHQQKSAGHVRHVWHISRGLLIHTVNIDKL